MKQYPKYKDSGIQWIGKIPEEWKEVKTLYALSMPITDGPHETPKFYDEGIPFVSAEAVSFGNGKIDFNHITGYITESFYEMCCKKYVPAIHDIYMIKSGATTGKVAIVDTDRVFTIWSPLAVFRCNPDVMHYQFLFYFLQSEPYQKQVQRGWSYGTQQNIGMRTLEKLKILIPPISDQQAIADYLDYKTSKIDECIRLLELQKTDLANYRKAIISQVVTRGLNPNAKLKDSGIEWIGQIPTEWMIDRCGHLFQTIGSGTTPQSGNERYYSAKGYNWLQTGDLNDNVINQTSKFITDLALKEYSLPIYPINSIVIAMYGATIGKLGILQIETCTNQACCVLANSMRMHHKYAFYCLFAGRQELINSANGGGQPNISQSIIRNFRLPIPPFAEQQAIVDYLDTKTAKIDETIANIDAQIADLRDYRSALISDVVTGKIDVRNAN